VDCSPKNVQKSLARLHPHCWNLVVLSDHSLYLRQSAIRQIFSGTGPEPFLPIGIWFCWRRRSPNRSRYCLSVTSLNLILLVLQLSAKKLFEYVNLQQTGMHPKSLNFFVVQMAFIEALGMTLLGCEFLKPFAGRKRPNFFAMCDYHGYRTAVATNNFTEYISLTNPGTPGKLSNCRATPREILESQFSFPSGHSAAIWCSMTFLALYLYYVLQYYSTKHNMSKGIGAITFLAIACMVSVTRPRDYWHNFDDILGGSILGFGCAALAFALNYSPIVTSAYNRVRHFDVDPDDNSPLFSEAHEAPGSLKPFDGETPVTYTKS